MTESKLLAEKAGQPWGQMSVMAALAGAFIAFGSVASLVARSNMAATGGVDLLAGVIFSVGLILVMIVGAQLFTGNVMLVLPAVNGELAVGRMLGAWSVVWLGNLIGSAAIALLFAAGGGLSGEVGAAAAAIGADKLAKSPFELFCSAILANMLVCVAVWMAMTAQSLAAKVLVIVGPVTIFVAAGLEHSIANMSLLPLAWLAAPTQAPALMAGAINLVTSTLGNIAGGALIALGIAFGNRTSTT